MPSIDDKKASGQIESTDIAGKYITAVGNIDGSSLPSASDIASAMSGLAISTQDFAIRIDDAGSGIVYIGKAVVGASQASSVWKILRVTESGSPLDTSIEYADGNSNYDNVWDNRASLSYS